MSAMPEYDVPLFTRSGEPTAHARNTDPAESHAAARSVRNITAVHRAILNLLRTPRTDEELYVKLRFIGVNVSPSGARSRRAELVAQGKVAKVGQGRTEAGRKCAVWGVQ